MMNDESLINNYLLPPIRSRFAIVNLFSSSKEIRDVQNISAVANLLLMASTTAHAALIAVITTIAALITATLSILQIFPSWVTGTMFTLLFLIPLFSYIHARVMRHKKDDNKEWARYFHIKQIVTIASIRSPRKIYYRYRYVIRPKRPTRTFRWSYLWSGDSELSVHVLNSRHSFQEEKIDLSRFIDFDFGREIGPNDTEVLDFYIVASAPRGKVLPSYFGYLVTTSAQPSYNTYIAIESMPGSTLNLYKSLQTSVVAGRGRVSWPVIDYQGSDIWAVPINTGTNYKYSWEWGNM